VGNTSKGITYSVHHPQFDVDEEALKIGTGILSYQLIQLLK
jgi:amidohydrolase